jgi:hypothetical protein
MVEPVRFIPVQMVLGIWNRTKLEIIFGFLIG